MAFSLYDATVAGYIRTVDSMAGILAKGADHCKETGSNVDDLVSSCLHDTMAPLQFQVVSVAHHSLGAVEGVRAGHSGPPPSEGRPEDYAGLQALIAKTREGLAAIDPAEVEGFLGKDVIFEVGDFKLPFAAEGFLMSFSIPNFHFHATTAYDILRHKGVPLGKIDYLGKLALKQA